MCLDGNDNSAVVLRDERYLHLSDNDLADAVDRAFPEP
jgi:hypothetical protein